MEAIVSLPPATGAFWTLLPRCGAPRIPPDVAAVLMRALKEIEKTAL